MDLTKPQIVTPWKKSTFSNPDGQDCVETAGTEDGGVAVRNSRRPEEPAQYFTRSEWIAFTKGVKADEFDI